MAKFLLQHGANPFAKNKEEKTPIDASQGGLAYLLPSNKQEEWFESLIPVKIFFYQILLKVFFWNKTIRLKFIL